MIHLYNTKTRQVEVFQPIQEKQVSLYSCGPTVYNYPHIGNYRAYIFADILKRMFLANGFDVNHVMNITDVDDKTIRDSQKEGKTLRAFTEFYTAEFMKDIESLHIIPANKYPRATAHIPEMISMIETLMDNNHAYKAADGSVYFDISSFPNYGKLAQIDFAGAKQTERVKNDEYTKDNVQDFALWKSYDPEDGDVSWDTVLGKGHPGWHIECSAMSTAYLGNHFDIHTGGVDNMFPHHENEIAQSVCAHGGEFVNYWMHNEHLMVDNKKMSKSLGNFYTLRDLQEKGFSPLAFRYFLLQAHYKTQTNFTWEALTASQNALRGLHHSARELKKKVSFFLYFFAKPDTDSLDIFVSHLNKDLDTPGALASLWDMMKSGLSPEIKLKTLLEINKTLGLGVEEALNQSIPKEIKDLVRERDRARESRHWQKADALREEIKTKGYDVLDNAEGTSVEKI